MGLTKSNTERDEYILGKKYNVEYELGNGKIGTMSNVLDYADEEYYYFYSKEDGMDIIKQNTIRTMICLKNKSE